METWNSSSAWTLKPGNWLAESAISSRMSGRPANTSSRFTTCTGEPERMRSARDARLGAPAPKLDEDALGMDLVARIGHYAQEPELEGRLVVRRDKRALALAAHQDVLRRELVDRLAHRALAHLVARGELELGRDRLARLPDAGDQALGEQDLDLLVERAEGGARLAGP